VTSNKQLFNVACRTPASKRHPPRHTTSSGFTPLSALLPKNLSLFDHAAMRVTIPPPERLVDLGWRITGIFTQHAGFIDALIKVTLPLPSLERVKLHPPVQREPSLPIE